MKCLLYKHASAATKQPFYVTYVQHFSFPVRKKYYPHKHNVVQYVFNVQCPRKLQGHCEENAKKPQKTVFVDNIVLFFHCYVNSLGSQEISFPPPVVATFDILLAATCQEY